MAKRKSRYNVKNGNGYDQLLFETIMSQIIDAPIKSLERNTAYKVNDICSEATLPKGGFLICETAGTTTNTVPTAFGTATDGATITDGTAKFTVRFLDQLVSSVNNNKPDSKGNITLPNFTGSTSSNNGSSGLVPAPKAGEKNKVLCADGSWYDILKFISDNYQAKEAGKGLSTNDFTKALLNKLNGIGSGANGLGIIASNLAQNGYVKFANKLILQWGHVTTSGSGVTSSWFTFPISLSVCYTAVASSFTTTRNASIGSGYVNGLSSSGCNVIHERNSGYTIIVLGR